MNNEAMEAKEKLCRHCGLEYSAHTFYSRHCVVDGEEWYTKFSSRLPERVEEAICSCSLTIEQVCPVHGVEESVKPCEHLCINSGVCTWCNEIVSPSSILSPKPKSDNHFLYASEYAGCTFDQAAAVAVALTHKGWQTPTKAFTPTASEDVGLPTRPKRYSTEIGVLQNQVPGRCNTWSKTSEDEDGDEIDAREFVIYADEIERQLLEARKEIARLKETLGRSIEKRESLCAQLEASEVFADRLKDELFTQQDIDEAYGNGKKAVEAALAAMTEDRNLWQQANDDDCPNKAALDQRDEEIARLREGALFTFANVEGSRATVAIEEAERMFHELLVERAKLKDAIFEYLSDGKHVGPRSQKLRDAVAAQ